MKIQRENYHTATATADSTAKAKAAMTKLNALNAKCSYTKRISDYFRNRLKNEG